MPVIYVGNLDKRAEREDLFREFDRYGKVVDVWIARNPPGFAFIEYEDHRDANDAIRALDDRYFMDTRVRVEMSKRVSIKDRSKTGGNGEGKFRVKVENIPSGTSWQDLKSHVASVVQPTFVDIVNGVGIVEFSSKGDQKKAVDRLHQTKFRDTVISVNEEQTEKRGRSRDRRDRRRKSHSRSRSYSGSRHRSRSGDRHRRRDNRRRDRDDDRDDDRSNRRNNNGNDNHDKNDNNNSKYDNRSNNNNNHSNADHDDNDDRRRSRSQSSDKSN